MAVKHAFTNPKSDGADATITRPGHWNADHTIDAISITEDKLFSAVKQPVRLVATTNQASLSGNLTIDGGTTAGGDVILLTAQTTATQNGPWIARSGAWARPSWFPAATAFSLVEKEQHVFIVWDGAAYGSTIWRSSLSAATTYTVDSDVLTYVQVTFGGAYFKVGGRIIGDFSDTTTPSNRIFFQSNNAANANTLIGCITAGTGGTTALHLYGSSDPNANQGYGRISFTSNDFRLVGNIVGSGTYPSVSIVTATSVRFSCNNIGDIILGKDNTFPASANYTATTNWAQLWLGSDATIAYATDTGAAKEVNITQNGYLNNAAWTYRESDFASQIRMLSGSVRFRYQASGTALAAMGAWTTALMMSNTGHILIGSTTDDGTNALQVTGSTKLTGALAMTGALTSYNGTTTSDFGQPVIVYSKLFTVQGAAIAATNLIASLAATGMYRVNWSATITRVATTSCSLGGANGFQVLFTSPGDSVAKTTKVIASDVNATNSTASAVYGVRTAYAKAATAMQFQFDYTSVGATAMQYELYITVEYLGPCAP